MLALVDKLGTKDITNSIILASNRTKCQDVDSPSGQPPYSSSLMYIAHNSPQNSINQLIDPGYLLQDMGSAFTSHNKGYPKLIIS